MSQKQIQQLISYCNCPIITNSEGSSFRVLSITKMDFPELSNLYLTLEELFDQYPGTFLRDENQNVLLYQIMIPTAKSV